MPYYSVSHPQLEVTATVEAPSSEKARTTFLDYLERTGKAKRNQRQLLRQAMATKRIVDGSEGYSDLELHYEYEHIPEVDILQLGGPTQGTPEGLSMSPSGSTEAQPVVEQGQVPMTRGLPPIQELALTGRTGG